MRKVHYDKCPVLFSKMRSCGRFLRLYEELLHLQEKDYVKPDCYWTGYNKSLSSAVVFCTDNHPRNLKQLKETTCTANTGSGPS